ncbi:MAG: DNA double-strand break repair nuclease NurA [Anaerolineales bacterium]|nr:DNA double-strand break repair nuclease NurA [Anaerolineales bacterium]
MALDYLEVRNEIEKLADHASGSAEKRQTRREQALDLLNHYASELDYLREKAQRANQLLPHYHVALPVNEPLNSSIPLPLEAPDLTLIAADGSQINPDRHMGTNYCLVNIGAIQMRPGSGDSPVTIIESKLYYGDEILSLPEETVSLMRDVREREVLAEMAESVTGPVITLTDGSLELWTKGSEPAMLDEFKKRYFEALMQLRQQGAITAGYTDRPRNALLTRLLEIAPEAIQPQDAGDHRPLKGLLDTELLAGVIKPGERSAIFGLLTRASRDYRGEFALHFFYLNVSSREGKPVLAKVDIPAWVARDPDMVNWLHAALAAQCRVIHTASYPYVLARADEIAVVGRKDQQKVAEMIAQALRERGLDVDGLSSKQHSKDAAR